jgi:hypothetical protein
MLTYGVQRKRPRRVRRGREHIFLLAYNNDIWCVSAASSFRMVRVYRPSTESGDCT